MNDLTGHISKTMERMLIKFNIRYKYSENKLHTLCIFNDGKNLSDDNPPVCIFFNFFLYLFSATFTFFHLVEVYNTLVQ